LLLAAFARGEALSSPQSMKSCDTFVEFWTRPRLSFVVRVFGRFYTDFYFQVSTFNFLRQKSVSLSGKDDTDQGFEIHENYFNVPPKSENRRWRKILSGVASVLNLKIVAFSAFKQIHERALSRTNAWAGTARSAPPGGGCSRRGVVTVSASWGEKLRGIFRARRDEKI
jgi:hypothetical protein